VLERRLGASSCNCMLDAITDDVIGSSVSA
jgi:hypothetical protein